MNFVSRGIAPAVLPVFRTNPTTVIRWLSGKSAEKLIEPFNPPLLKLMALLVTVVDGDRYRCPASVAAAPADAPEKTSKSTTWSSAAADALLMILANCKVVPCVAVSVNCCHELVAVKTPDKVFPRCSLKVWSLPSVLFTHTHIV